jgi:hypothetical protein
MLSQCSTVRRLGAISPVYLLVNKGNARKTNPFGAQRRQEQLRRNFCFCFNMYEKDYVWYKLIYDEISAL